MKNITAPVRFRLRMRYRLRKPGELERALGAFSPVGVSAAAETPEGRIWTCAYGQAVVGERPVREHTLFRVASVSKLLGAAAALRLVGEGRLSLDGDIAEALGFSAGRRITLRQLLTHTAGLRDRLVYDRVAGEPNLPPLDRVLRGSVAWAPGARFHYSNLGAGTAGMLVEAASGMPFDDYVRQAFFLPYGIDASFHPQRILQKDRMANCYRAPQGTLAYDAHAIAGEPLDDTVNPQRHYTVPAGKLMISAPDLLHTLRLLWRECREMFALQNHVGSVRCRAARGLGAAYMPSGIIAGSAFWGHQGVAYGALSEAWLDAETGRAAVLLTNGLRLSAAGPLYKAGQAGLSALLDPTATDGVY